MVARKGQLVIPRGPDLGEQRREVEDPRKHRGAQPASDLRSAERGVRVVSGAPRRYRLIGTAQAVTDALAILLALPISYVLRFEYPIPRSYLVVMATMPFLWIATFRVFSLHSPQLLSAWEEFRRVIAASSVGMVLVIMTSFWSRASLSRAWVGLTWLLVLGLEFVSRRFWRWLTYRWKADGRLALRTFIVGAGDEAYRLADALDGPASGFRPVGYVSVNEKSETVDGLPLVGDIDDLVPSLYDYGVDCLFIAEPSLDQKQMIKIAQAARQQDVEIRFAAHLPEILSPRLSVQPIGGIMTLAVRPVRLTKGQAALKRSFDLFVSCIGLLVAAPFLMAIGVAIKATSKGPIFFRQHRVTKGGHLFRMYKFRTMREDADELVREKGIDTSVPFFKMGPDDPRLTKVGSLLRKTSLDELPQLINVLRGEMSLVGPRPLPADQVAANLELLGPRHEVPAGVTGWWQVQGRSEIEDPDEAVRMDLFYIENWSLALDLYVIFKTFGAVIAKKGAF